MLSVSSEDIRKDIELFCSKGTLETFEKWYKHVTSDYGYIVFLDSNSYNLGLICEKMIGIKMVDKYGKEFLTSSALTLRINELVEHYKQYDDFPSIRICANMLKYGKDINHYLEVIESLILEKLGDNDRDRVIDKIVKAVQIVVVASRRGKSSLILGRYALNITRASVLDDIEFNELSNKIQMLITRYGLINSSYLISTQLDKDRIDTDKFVETVYRNTKEKTFVRLINNKVITTLRLIENTKHNCYIAIPFVIVPNLGSSETGSLMKLIENSEVKAWLNEAYNIKGKRSFNELLQLILSNAILKEIGLNDYTEYEIERLSRNYSMHGKDKTKEMLKSALYNTNIDLKQLANECIQDKKKIFNGNNSSVNKDSVIDTLENYFYNSAFSQEKESFELNNMQYFETWRRSERIVRGINFVIKELSSNCSELLIAYMLNIVDAGVAEISAYGPKKMDIVGLSTFIGFGEQAISINALRFYEYIPLLVKIELTSYKPVDLEKITDDKTAKALNNFVDELKQIGQTPYSWAGNYLLSIDFEENGKSRVFNMNKFTENQEKHVKDYLEQS